MFHCLRSGEGRAASLPQARLQFIFSYLFHCCMVVIAGYEVKTGKEGFMIIPKFAIVHRVMKFHIRLALLLLCLNGHCLVFLVCLQQLLSKHLVNDSHYLLSIRCPALSENINSDEYVVHIPSSGSWSLLIVMITLHLFLPFTALLAALDAEPCTLPPPSSLAASVCLPVEFSDGTQARCWRWQGECGWGVSVLFSYTWENSSGCSCFSTPAAPATWALFQYCSSPWVLVMSIPPSSGLSGPCYLNLWMPWHLLLASWNLPLVPSSNSFQNPSLGTFHFLMALSDTLSLSSERRQTLLSEGKDRILL